MFTLNSDTFLSETTIPPNKAAPSPDTTFLKPRTTKRIMVVGSSAGNKDNPPPVAVVAARLTPQWGPQETKEFIYIRAELERVFSSAKRNKTLWEAVSAKMRDRGYSRTPDQCKCKWKNLVNRYKGKETSDADKDRPCPFFEELHAVFTDRAKNLQQLLDSEAAGYVQAKKTTKRGSGEQSADEFSEEERNDEDASDDNRTVGSSKSRKRKIGGEISIHTAVLGRSEMLPTAANHSYANCNSIQEMLKKFLQQQQRNEMEWRQMMERHADERQRFEQEWRQRMEKIERERLKAEQAWREREEQRRIREELRAEKRDAILTSLLNKLIHDT